MNMKTHPKAFSLIELLVALSILAVVAAIIVPRFLNVRSQAGMATASATVKEIQAAMDKFQAMGGTMAATVKTGDILGMLSTTNATAARPNTNYHGITDSGGVMGSYTIALGVGTSGTGNGQFSYATGNNATWYDGSGTAWTLKLDANNKVYATGTPNGMTTAQTLQ